MSRPQNIEWVINNLAAWDIRDKRVLDVGSKLHFDEPHIWGYLETLSPAEIIGFDMEDGPCVTVVGKAEKLNGAFPLANFHAVFCLEVLEHVEDWRTVVENLKAMVRPGGILVVTTRTPGYPRHGYPDDFWRFTAEDFRRIFADLKQEALMVDEADHGIYAIYRKRVYADLSRHGLRKVD